MQNRANFWRKTMTEHVASGKDGDGEVLMMLEHYLSRV